MIPKLLVVFYSYSISIQARNYLSVALNFISFWLKCCLETVVWAMSNDAPLCCHVSMGWDAGFSLPSSEACSRQRLLYYGNTASFLLCWYISFHSEINSRNFMREKRSAAALIYTYFSPLKTNTTGLKPPFQGTECSTVCCESFIQFN